MSTRVTVMEAIAKKQILAALYNGAQIKLAPHVLFERHGDLFVSALNLNKNWGAEDARLGQFKLAGLGATKLLDEVFDPLPAFDAAAPRSDDTLLMIV